ncbi:hypothetical protein [Alkalimonas mucilaginosa]|uniref:Uncharacterized protein n=1 Tax=Alkalimonas mucilaginosa TaxID=3057676 RepID=A0ABU7JIG0_9GAMM|nr:hypothetical protein [Alkalimonas sp. MEB004]MEE2024880.1 hypothetical protein [Alkalimonas sp. MEB004]
MHPQLRINPQLHIWLDSDANIQVAVDFDGVNFDWLYASDLFIRHSAKGFYCRWCTEPEYWQDPIALWRHHVLEDFINWVRKQLFAHDSLELCVLERDWDKLVAKRAAGDNAETWHNSTTWARFANLQQILTEENPLTSSSTGVFPLWHSKPVHPDLNCVDS